MAAYDAAPPELRHIRDQLLDQVTRALFLDWPAAERVTLILGLYRHELSPRQLQALRSCDPAFVLARFKQVLPQPFVLYAELQAAFRVWQHGQSTTR